MYRKGLRYYEGPSAPEPIPFEACTFNLISDSLENMIQRSIGQQQALEQVRNEVRGLLNVFGVAIEKRLKS
jgi:hypothetical protein